MKNTLLKAADSLLLATMIAPLLYRELAVSALSLLPRRRALREF